MENSKEKFKIFLKNPRIGSLLAGDRDYFSLEEAIRAANNWKAVQFLTHWHILIRDQSGKSVFEQ
jgi:hypothetical protein